MRTFDLNLCGWAGVSAHFPMLGRSPVGAKVGSQEDLRLVLRETPPARPSEARSGTLGAGAAPCKINDRGSHKGTEQQRRNTQ